MKVKPKAKVPARKSVLALKLDACGHRLDMHRDRVMVLRELVDAKYNRLDESLKIMGARLHQLCNDSADITPKGLQAFIENVQTGLNAQLNEILARLTKLEAQPAGAADPRWSQLENTLAKLWVELNTHHERLEKLEQPKDKLADSVAKEYMRDMLAQRLAQLRDAHRENDQLRSENIALTRELSELTKWVERLTEPQPLAPPKFESLQQRLRNRMAEREAERNADAVIRLSDIDIAGQPVPLRERPSVHDMALSARELAEKARKRATSP